MAIRGKTLQQCHSYLGRSCLEVGGEPRGQTLSIVPYKQTSREGYLDQKYQVQSDAKSNRGSGHLPIVEFFSIILWSAYKVNFESTTAAIE